MELSGKVAILTGASRGLGLHFADALARKGVDVALAARSEQELKETEDRIRRFGVRAISVPTDVGKLRDLQNLVDRTTQELGPPDVLVNNAGIDCESPVVDMDIDLLDRCLAVNVRAPLLLCKFALPGMLAQGSGSIFCISSGAARGYRPGRVGYSMSKAALERTFLNLAEEVRPANIAVNVLSPGRVDTWMNRRGDWPGTAHIPMAQPEAIIPAAVWLAQQTATSFTGQVVERADFGVTWGPPGA